MLSRSERGAALMHFFLLVHGGIGLRDDEDDLAAGFVHILNAEHTDPELLHFLLQLADKLVRSRHILSKTELLKPAA